MHNYSDTTVHAHHDEDEVQVMRAVFCSFHCCKAQLANNYRNESLWGTFASMFVKEAVSLKQQAAYLHTIGRTRKYSWKQASLSKKRCKCA